MRLQLIEFSIATENVKKNIYCIVLPKEEGTMRKNIIKNAQRDWENERKT